MNPIQEDVKILEN